MKLFLLGERRRGKPHTYCKLRHASTHANEETDPHKQKLHTH